MIRILTTAFLVTIFVCVPPAALRADEQESDGGSSAQKLAQGDQQTVDRILDTAVSNIARRYNLNSLQREKTAEIMNREVYRFLREHEDEVWPLVRDFLARGAWGKPPEKVEEMKRIGRAASPMMKKIQEAIVRGNEEWRMYLSDEQKVMHDWDMAEIDKTFRKVDKNLERWAKGDASAGGVFPPPPPRTAGPKMPPRPPAEELLEPEITSIFEPKRLFDAFVENFIRQYHLDQSQRDAARSILDEYKATAMDFRNGKNSELKAVGAKWLAAQEAGNRKALLEAERERKELLQPVHGMLGEMESRLMALLTTAQKQKYSDKARDAQRASRTARKPTTRASETKPKRKVEPASNERKSGESDGKTDSGRDGR